MIKKKTFASSSQAEFNLQKSRGRCLHFERGERCNKVIDAHSIQKNGQLRQIEEAGHVYRFSADLSTLQKNHGHPAPTKVGWNKVTTFLGFCRLHDNELFKPIDERPLVPDRQQAALYAYRSLCREFFVKENVVRALSTLQNHAGITHEANQFLQTQLYGNTLGFNRLKFHKAKFDESFIAQNFADFEYLTFASTSPWSLQLSGVLYPDFDFEGNQLQDLIDEISPMSLVTFFTAPMSKGWTFSFCWHRSSHNICERLTRSLAFAMHRGALIEDTLLRFAFSCCENHAIRISWWDALATKAREAIMERCGAMTDPLIITPANYLTQGLEGIADWKFDSVFSTIQ